MDYVLRLLMIVSLLKCTNEEKKYMKKKIIHNLPKLQSTKICLCITLKCVVYAGFSNGDSHRVFRLHKVLAFVLFLT